MRWCADGVPCADDVRILHAEGVPAPPELDLASLVPMAVLMAWG